MNVDLGCAGRGVVGMAITGRDVSKMTAVGTETSKFIISCLQGEHGVNQQQQVQGYLGEQ